MINYFGVYDTSDNHWEFTLGLFSTKKAAQSAADEKCGFWRERYKIRPVASWQQSAFYNTKWENLSPVGVRESKEGEKNMQEDLDTWGVWDTTDEYWISGYYDERGKYHEREGINYNHAINAANKMNENHSYYRYEARDMTANEKTVIDDEPVKSIQEMIDDRKGTIAHLQDEIKALEMTLTLMGKSGR